ncbi:hypothetical protein GTA51_04030 [Desulfovibrio aerotolerans]|uniref:Glycosyltransferase RgtA/B/C/D-like domain-containing protein n=1 Tax=Solidesulfovibrio aerotolerans TaxID=295255 RepID=A0A7C9IJL5_9BACT|nr:hypothetical protein [Solidesulfovibrio aerotolerans]MYL82305.1 hypothetical protein [Solidesulfovibrio aerotolerans]
MIEPSDRGIRRFDWWLVACISLGVYALAHRLGLASPFVINDDARQQLFWMARWLDPALYPPDLLSDYAAAYVPAGVKALYFVAVKGFGLEPLFVSKLVAGALFVLLALALFGLGVALEGPTLGWFAAAMAWLMPYFLKNISGGLSRAFAGPLLALFVLAWMRRCGRGMAWVLLLEAVTIPYIAILCAGCACLDAVMARLTDRPAAPFPARSSHGLALLAAAAMVIGQNVTLAAKGFGPLVGRAALAAGPEFSAAGRLELYPLPNPFFDLFYWPLESIGLFLEWGLFPGIVSLAVLAPVLWYGARSTPWPQLAAKVRPLAMLLAGSLALYVLARAIALVLFVPDRYICYTINLCYALVLAVCLRHALAPLLTRRWAGAALVLLAAGLGVWRLTNVGLYDYRADAPLYAAVAALPADALVAGNPKDMDNVLTFGRRNVLASYELAHAWSVGLWKSMLPRLAHQAEAYYAKDATVVREFAKAYGVGWIVVREADFEPAAIARGPLFAPFDRRIQELAGAPGNFVLLNEAQFPYTSPEPGVRLVDVRPAAQPAP